MPTDSRSLLPLPSARKYRVNKEMAGGRKLREEGEHGMSSLKKMKAQPTIFTQKKQKNYRNDGKGTHGDPGKTKMEAREGGTAETRIWGHPPRGLPRCHTLPRYGRERGREKKKKEREKR